MISTKTIHSNAHIEYLICSFQAKGATEMMSAMCTIGLVVLLAVQQSVACEFW